MALKLGIPAPICDKNQTFLACIRAPRFQPRRGCEFLSSRPIRLRTSAGRLSATDETQMSSARNIVFICVQLYFIRGLISLGVKMASKSNHQNARTLAVEYAHACPEPPLRGPNAQAVPTRKTESHFRTAHVSGNVWNARTRM